MDLDMERNHEITRETIRAIRNGNRAADRQKVARAALQGFMAEAVELLAAGDEGSLVEAGADAGRG